MKTTQPLLGTWTIVSITLLITFLITSCDDGQDDPKTLPEVSTAAISNITTTSATGGGNIVSDGNDEILAMGLVYSSTNNMPTTNDSRTVVTTTTTAFTSDLSGLSSGTTYHVRAYLTNSLGTDYGAVVDFTTGNNAPTASDVEVTGDAKIDSILTASYSYKDAENDIQSGTTFQWYSANATDGTDEIAIIGANSSSYTIQATDEFKYIRIGITPKASTGTVTGQEVKSNYIGPIPEAPETVTFTYNGAIVKYGVIKSSVTGRKWLDRNLGASQSANSFDDYEAYGDLFQWGRAADGHQLITWSGCCSAGDGVGKNGTTTELCNSDSPAHKLFIIDTTNPSDWRSPKNDNLWQGVNGTNNPCPTGWRIPTREEFDEEIANESYVGLGQLKMTGTGYRKSTDGTIHIGGSTGAGGRGYYWSSSIDSSGPDAAIMYFFKSEDPAAYSLFYPRASAGACRCIKDE